MTRRRRHLRGLVALATLSAGFVVAVAIIALSPAPWGGPHGE